MKTYTENGVTLVFYKKPNDEKYSFAIKGDDELTNILLSNVSKKRVSEKDIFFAKKGLFEKLKNNSLIQTNMNNPIVELAEKCQKKFRKSMVTRVTGKEGADHNPTITVEIELPNGKKYLGSGINQKIAKQNAAEEALKEI
jgi:dsRNA-specific ribonuclease